MRKRLINARDVWFRFGGVFFGIGRVDTTSNRTT